MEIRIIGQNCAKSSKFWNLLLFMRKKHTIASNNQYKLKKWFVQAYPKVFYRKCGHWEPVLANPDPETRKHLSSFFFQNSYVPDNLEKQMWCWSIFCYSILSESQNMAKGPMGTCSDCPGSGKQWSHDIFIEFIKKLF